MIIVGIGDYNISNNKHETMITYALGSCVALVIYNKQNGWTAMAHIVLPNPSSGYKHDDHRMKPGYFATDIVPKLLEFFLGELKSKKSELSVYIVGGADSIQEKDVFLVGQKNVEIVTHLLNIYGISQYESDTGGNVSRTVSIQCWDGYVLIKNQKMIL